MWGRVRILRDNFHYWIWPCLELDDDRSNPSRQRLRHGAPGTLRPGGDRLVRGETHARAGVAEAPQQRLEHVQVLAARQPMAGRPGARVGHDSGLGAAVQRHGTAGAEHFLSAADHRCTDGSRWRGADSPHRLKEPPNPTLRFASLPWTLTYWSMPVQSRIAVDVQWCTCCMM